jgi:hypothetical protein
VKEDYKVQVYEGYVENGNFYPINKLIRLPERKRAIITILDEPALKDRLTMQDITLASEDSLAKVWLSPKEDEAWADL